MLPVEPRSARFLEGRDELAELGVHAGAVVALVVVLGDHFPIGAHVIDDAPRGRQRVERIAPHALRHRAELLDEVARTRPRGPEVQEEESAPERDADGVEREVVLAQSRVLVEERGSEEAPVQAVGPRVVRAPDRPAGRKVPAGGSALPRGGVGRAETRPAVTTHVVVRREPALARPRQQNAFAQDLEDAHGPRLREPVGAPRAEPLAGEDPFALLREDLAREVVLRGQRFLEHRRLRYFPSCL